VLFHLQQGADKWTVVDEWPENESKSHLEVKRPLPQIPVVAIWRSSQGGHVASMKKSAATTRAQKKCPVKNCGAKVIHIPRHLRDVHHWKKQGSMFSPTRI
jgi:hypothetical protein